MGRADEDFARQKGGCQVVEEQAVRHLFYCWFVLHPEKPFDVGRLVQRIRVLVDHRELFHL